MSGVAPSTGAGAGAAGFTGIAFARSRSRFSSRYALMTVVLSNTIARCSSFGLNMVLIARAMPCDTAPA